MTARDVAVRCMRDQIGKPYVWGTHGPKTFDCSGLTSYCAGKAGLVLSPSSHEQFTVGTKITMAQAEPGDLLFYTSGTGADHVGMVVDDTMAVHALNPNLGIREVRIDSQNLGVTFIGARSIFPPEGAAGGGKNETLVTPDSHFRALGNTDLESFRSALSRSVTDKKSPMVKEADAIYAALVPRGLTRLAAAMCWIERSNETNPDGLAYYPWSYHNAWAVKNRDGSWAQYRSYADAAFDWSARILGPAYADLQTLGELIARYAPASDGNNPAAYGKEAAKQVNALPRIADPAPPITEPTPAPTPWSPRIYDLRNDGDAQRFGLAPWQRDQILAKRIEGREGARPEIIGLHVQWGMTPGSLEHWLGVAASSTVMVQMDGSVLKVIPEEHGPWTQGDVNGPDAHMKRLLKRFGPDDPNPYSLTIECEDNRTEDINAAQEKTVLWLIRGWAAKYPWMQPDLAERIVGHYEINSVDRANCGKYRDRIVGMLDANVPPPLPLPGFEGLPAWLPAEHFRVAFPLADPTGSVTKAVIAWTVAQGKVPWFLGKVDVGGGRNLWRFTEFTLLSEGAHVWMEGQRNA